MSSPAPQAQGLFDCRDAYVKTLEALGADDDRIVAVVNDSVGSSKLGGFRDKFPTRLINVGIAEQNMVGVGAGLANGGKIAFVSGASCFLTGRSLEQVKADCAYSQANVKLCGISSGVAYGELGPTHHSIEDVAWLRTMGDITVLVPADPWETEQAIRAAAAMDGPVFVRISRMGVPALPRPADAVFEIGKAEVLHQGNDAAIIANGTVVCRALEAAAELAAQGINARVINMASMSPIDEAAILEAAKTGAIVTAEEHSVRGGLGSAVAEIVSQNTPCRMKILGFAGFQPTGSAEFLMERAGLSASNIAASVRALVQG
ncbi:transketolase family protein [Novosphingobium sp. FSY-8]|uniref:Transketolase family protein n=1 Tax=Novosphingobium ovatum TaxID=1908523 RepID=A0ABW9XBE7_9SPHN|nr:transketolase C-terminal domain-containing protein [Novosphingobium ovatum]NBC35820.1 transketolase family protein [Novosphingobium ovatum]